ncbi:hypothetical protein OF377_01380 [Ureaplasma sp. ES3154-GEN]|uniref:hypothetical protein n=1 Tax=Ureaplasma sp. ES3154-GEN TaxID=2984844 RepID=UPI0021E7F0EE|nr:hypothetical protein [Ureaplasma sp. ES3154-GEN]MCV3743539.1 hypothetical protein [Ureaplasma sp. ES3154-GEN]
MKLENLKIYFTLADIEWEVSTLHSTARLTNLITKEIWYMPLFSENVSLFRLARFIKTKILNE